MKDFSNKKTKNSGNKAPNFNRTSNILELESIKNIKPFSQFINPTLLKKVRIHKKGYLEITISVYSRI
jgi:hypothetical protein